VGVRVRRYHLQGMPSDAAGHQGSMGGLELGGGPGVWSLTGRSGSVSVWVLTQGTGTLSLVDHAGVVALVDPSPVAGTTVEIDGASGVVTVIDQR